MSDTVYQQNTVVIRIFVGWMISFLLNVFEEYLSKVSSKTATGHDARLKKNSLTQHSSSSPSYRTFSLLPFFFLTHTQEEIALSFHLGKQLQRTIMNFNTHTLNKDLIVTKTIK